MELRYRTRRLRYVIFLFDCSFLFDLILFFRVAERATFEAVIAALYFDDFVLAVEFPRISPPMLALILLIVL